MAALDDDIANAHNLANDDERPRGKAWINCHQGWSSNQSESNTQTALRYSPSRGKSDDDDDLKRSQDRIP